MQMMIEMWDCVEYFMGLLGEVEEKVVKGMKGERKGDDGEITRKEVKRVIGRVKVEKAVGRWDFRESMKVWREKDGGVRMGGM